MVFLIISLVLLLLALIARVRTPEVGAIRPFWFAFSLLPSELPWLFGALQLFFTLVLLAVFDPVSATHLAALVLSLLALLLWYRLHQKTFTSGPILEQALRAGLGEHYQQQFAVDAPIRAPAVIGEKHWLKPFSYRRAGVERVSDVAYGGHPRQTLDIYRAGGGQAGQPVTGSARPVLLYVHGGGWVIGRKHQQGQPLLNYLAQNGWLCVDINYRLAPKHRFPDALIDVKTAIAWIKENIHTYGGNPNFIAVSGGSAGGHLCALAALTANNPQFQPGFEQADTSVQAAVPIYGVYDFTNSMNSWSGRTLKDFVQRRVMPSPYAERPELWLAASPKFQLHDKSPPMMLIHGSTDALVFVEEARDFAATLAAATAAPWVYAELPGAQHGFDLFHSVRTEYTLEAIGKFLMHCYQAARESARR